MSLLGNRTARIEDQATKSSLRLLDHQIKSLRDTFNTIIRNNSILAVTSVAKSGASKLVGDIKLKGGSNVTLTQNDSSKQITITATGVSPANPTASVGLTAVNGSAATFMRSDGAPSLDVSISPTWTGIHTHANNVAFDAGTRTIAGIQNQNLVDKTATESISGAWTYNTGKLIARDLTGVNAMTNPFGFYSETDDAVSPSVAKDAFLFRSQGNASRSIISVQDNTADEIFKLQANGSISLGDGGATDVLIMDGNDDQILRYRPDDGNIDLGGGGFTTGGHINVASDVSEASTNYGINFIPTWGANTAGGAIATGSITDTAAGAYFSGRPNSSSATYTQLIGGAFTVESLGSAYPAGLADVAAGYFQVVSPTSANGITNLYGVWVEGTDNRGKSGKTFTNGIGVYIGKQNQANSKITNARSLEIEEQTVATGENMEILLQGGGEIFFRDSALSIGSGADSFIDYTADGGHRFDSHVHLPVYTDGTRGAAGTAGRVIFNSGDGQLNIDDGTNWILPDGTTT